MLVRVINPAGGMSLLGVGVDAPVPVGQPVVALVNTQGVSINPADLDATAKGRSPFSVAYQVKLTSLTNFTKHLKAYFLKNSLPKLAQRDIS